MGPIPSGLGISHRGRRLDNCPGTWNPRLLQLLRSLVEYGLLREFGWPGVGYQCNMAVDRRCISGDLRWCDVTEWDARSLRRSVGRRWCMAHLEGAPLDAAADRGLGDGGSGWPGLLFFAGRIANAQPREVVCRRPVGRRAAVSMARQRAHGGGSAGRWVWPGSFQRGVSSL